MNFLSKKTRLKLISQALVMTSIIGIGTGYNLIIRDAIKVNASTTLVANEIGIKKVFSNNYNTYFIKNNGTVWGSGANGSGRLGIGNTTNQISPVQIPITDVKDIITIGATTFFMKNDGTVWGCGNNAYGQLGMSNTIANQLSPIQVSITNISNITGDMSNTLFLKNDGTVWGCGANDKGQLGLGNVYAKTSPVQLPISEVQRVNSGEGFSFFTKNDGTIWGTGYNADGQLGIGSTTNQLSPVQIPISNIKDIHCGMNHTIFSKNDDTVWGTGRNSKGELGIGNITNQLSPVKIPINNVSNITGGEYTIFTKNDGTLWANGRNEYGQLDLGNTTNQTSPVQIPITNVISVSGWTQTVFIKDDGTIWGCGNNSYGQLGLGYTVAGTPLINLSEVWLSVDVATQNVVVAESSKSQADIDIAQISINKLINSISKTNLQTRLNVVQNAIYLTDATTKVTTAESTKTQANVDIAQTAINLLPTGNSNRISLQARLDVIKTYMSYQTQLATVTKSVVNAETSKLQADVTSATTLVNALTNATDKTNLTARLTVVQTYINNVTDATTKVTNAEITKTQSNVDTAQTAINILPTGDTNRVSLQSRLNVVKAYIDYQTQLATATSAVVKAEGSKLQVDVDNANILVTALTNVTDKTALQSRLTVVQTAIDKANQDLLDVADATTKVENAETAKTQSNVDLAQTAINILPTGDTNRVSLQSRLDEVKAYIEYQEQLATTTSAVVKAEGSKLQADVDSANTLVTALTNVSDKTALQTRLTAVQTYITNVTSATTKVVTAESVKTQANVDLAQTTINILPTEDTNRVSLQSRLDIVKAYISYQAQLATATSAVVKSEGSKLQADVDSANTLVTALTNVSDKTALQTRLTAVQTYITNVADATTKVVTAESVKTQANVDLTQTTINILPTGDTNRVSLQSRLDIVKAYIAYQAQLATATSAVVKAEGSKLQADVDSANTLVTALTNVTDKTNLLNRLTVVQTTIDKANQDALNLADATIKVVTAETAKTQANVDLAQTAINILSNSSWKTALQNRLDVVQSAIDKATQDAQDLIDAQNKLNEALNTKSSTDIDVAQDTINALPDGTDKTNLQNQLDVIKNQFKVYNATQAVTNAETTKTQANVDLAQTAINLLPTGDTNRVELQTRLNTVQTVIDKSTQDTLNLVNATMKVTNAETTKAQSDVDLAKVLVNALTNVTDKTNLTNRLTIIQTEIDKATQDTLDLADATMKVTNAETTKTQANVDLAQTAIDLLTTGTDKTTLQTRLDVVKAYTTYQVQLTTVTSEVVKAETSKLQADVDLAKVLVNALTNVTDKTNLTNRLNVVQTAIDKAKQDALNLADATTKVTNAETTKTQANVDLAQTAINLLSTGTDKTSLQARLDVVKSYLTQLATATNAITKAELSKLQVDVDNAIALVNALPNGTDKTTLQGRVDVAQASVDITAPDVPIINGDVTTLNNGKISVSITYPSDASVQEYKLNNGDWTTYSPPILAGDQDTVYTRCLDSAGNMSKISSLVVYNIMPPTITIASYNTNTTNQGITVTATTDKGTLNQSSHTFTENGEFVFTATDDLGNIGTKTVIITNIVKDTTLPIITIADYDTKSTNKPITVTATTDKGTLNKSSYTFTENGSFEFTATDESGNVSTKTVTITNIVMLDYKDVELKVRWAEAYITNNTVNDKIATAQIAINKLPDCVGKNALQNRINKVKAQIIINAQASLISQAKVLVKQAELMKKELYFTKAWAIVNQLLPSDIKDSHMNRLKALGSDLEIK